ncbi:hypothetical protein K449DRAFT_465445 [Hypoxylon sp. EC38]|nr:hypothetical protein K449DRAFT_465445 [Hypoxylon sp. EC38]
MEFLRKGGISFSQQDYTLHYKNCFRHSSALSLHSYVKYRTESDNLNVHQVSVYFDWENSKGRLPVSLCEYSTPVVCDEDAQSTNRTHDTRDNRYILLLPKPLQKAEVAELEAAIRFHYNAWSMSTKGITYTYIERMGTLDAKERGINEIKLLTPIRATLNTKHVAFCS